MPNDFGLLLYPVSLQHPARLQCVIITAQWVTVEKQIPSPTRLGLPDVGHLVDEVRLKREGRKGEILAIVLSRRVEVNVSHRGHRHPARLKRKEFAPPDRHARVIDSLAEYTSRKIDLARGKLTLPADRASVRQAIAHRPARPGRLVTQRSSPAARTSA